MFFKLVQIDSDNPVKIKLEVGTHIFGRGKLLNLQDKRISRQHGQFKVTDDSLTVTALHQNPCYYRKKETTEAQILRQNCSISLNSGDKLGLLPTSLWYEVLQCSPADSGENKQPEKIYQQNGSQAISVDSGEETDNEELRVAPVSNANFTENDNFETQSTEIVSPCELNNKSDSDGKDIDKTSVDSRLSTDLDSSKTHEPVLDEPMSPSIITSNQDEEEKSDAAESSSTEPSSALHKRPHSGSEEESEEVKKVKTEPEESETKPAVKCDPDGQQAGSSTNNATGNGLQAAPAAAPTLRERCMYGASCYRRNPVHVAQYSHPSDGDWGAGAQAPCPYGAACGKRDPRHWRDHSHPPGKDQPPPHPGRKRKRRDRSETPPDVHIVTGKRVRRPVVNANFSGSDESDSDPYKTDEDSDEWQPSSEHTESQN